MMLGLIAGKYVSSASTLKKLPIYSVQTDESTVAITFDAAWTNQDTEELIKILKKHKRKKRLLKQPLPKPKHTKKRR